MTADPTASRETTRPPCCSGGLGSFSRRVSSLPTGLILAAFLARRLGPGGYGLFAVTAAVIAWIEWSLTALFSRASSAGGSWQTAPIGVASAPRSSALALFPGDDRGTPARRTGDPDFGHARHPRSCRPLRLFAADDPVFCLAQAHRNVLVGLGDFGERALAPRPRDGSAASCS